MPILVAGTVRVPPANLAALKSHMTAMLSETRKEDGCIDYSFAEEAGEAGVLRIFEIWRDEAALKAHFKSPHMAVWRAAGEELGVGGRNLSIYEIASSRPL